MAKLTGVIASLITPLNHDGSFDKKGMSRLVSHLIGSGIDGVFTLGSAGEAPCFTIEEREEIIQEVVSTVRGRVPVLVGIGHNSTLATLAYRDQARRRGADFVVLLPPTWRTRWITDEDVLHHVSTIAAKSQLPIVMYNLPAEAVPLHRDLVKKLATLQRVAAIKDSSGIANNIACFARYLPTFQGEDTQIYDALQRNAAGVISGMATIIPEKIITLYGHYRTGEKERAQHMQQDVSRITNLLFRICHNPLAGEKYCLSLQGICKPYVRAPYQQLTEKEKTAIRKHILPLLGTEGQR